MSEQKKFIVNKIFDKLNDKYRLYFLYYSNSRLNNSFVYFQKNDLSTKYTSTINILNKKKHRDFFLYNIFIDMPISAAGNEFKYIYDGLEGSFIIPNIRESPKIICVSCNDISNEETAWNSYHLQSKHNAWATIEAEKPHLIIHMGDFVYADEVYTRYKKYNKKIQDNKFIFPEELEYKYMDLFVAAYKCNEVFRNSWNLYMFDDHEYVNDITKRVFENKKLGVSTDLDTFYFNKIRELLIQISLFPSSFINEKLSDKYLFNYVVSFGIYNIIFIDITSSYYYFQQRFSPKILTYVNDSLKYEQYNLVVYSKPIYGSKPLTNNAFTYDSLQFINLLLKKKNDLMKISCCAGDIHSTMIVTYQDDENKNNILKEVIASGVSRQSFKYYYGIFFPLYKLFTTIAWFFTKKKFKSDDKIINIDKNNLGYDQNYALLNNNGTFVNKTINFPLSFTDNFIILIKNALWFIYNFNNIYT